MAYLATFYWGWLLGSALVGLAMGWISVVQHGDGVPRKWCWVLAALAAALVGAGSRPFRLLARPRPDHVWAVSLRLRGRFMAARLGGFAQPARGLRPVPGQLLGPVIASPLPQAGASRPLSWPESSFGRRECSKTVLPLSSTSPNMLKKRVLLSYGEFHSGPKRATRGVREQPDAGGLCTAGVVAGWQFEV